MMINMPIGAVDPVDPSDLLEPDPLRTEPAEVSTVSIPAGLWLRAGGPRLSGADDAAFRWPAEPDRFAVLVGAPGELTPTAAQVAAAIGALPAGAARRAVLTTYGAEPAGADSLAQRLADRLDSPVRAQHGLLLPGPDGIARRIAVDRSGRPSWRPFAEFSTYRPARSDPAVDRWQAPFPGAFPAGPAGYRLTADWTVDVVPAGLVVRPAGTQREPGLGAAPADPDHVDLIVAGDRLPDVVLTSLGRLADALPTPARDRLRVVLTAEVTTASARALRWAVPAPQIDRRRSGPPGNTLAPVLPITRTAR